MSLVQGTPANRAGSGDFEAGTYARPCARLEDLKTGTDDYRDVWGNELASALAKKWGTKVYGLYEVCKAACSTARKPLADPVHHVAITPDEMFYVDIHGVWDEASLTAYWHELQVCQSLSNLPYYYVLREVPAAKAELSAPPPSTFFEVFTTIARLVKV